MTIISRYQIKICGSGYIMNGKTPIKFNNRCDAEMWIQENEHNYNNRLCVIPILN